ncbi:hypothetical protein WKI65_21965 [Streptomyces sp. MS1.AVA.3]|uniref:hypothetical protein n=1 Tax=Streptomyces decoyicus TaxID=249567 RepID=UPI0030C02E0C
MHDRGGVLRVAYGDGAGADGRDLDNLNVLGRYSFTASTPVGGGLRPLRDPDVAGPDDEEDGGED